MAGLSFQHPQLLILLLLLPLVWRFLTCRRLAVSSILRLGVAALGVLALAGPRLALTGSGRDLVVLVDRSASDSAEAARMLREIWPLIKRDERPGDRTALVGFGAGALVERGFGADAADSPLPDGFADASDLAAALRLAAGLRDPERPAAVLCLSDGLANREDPLAAAVAAGYETLPFWYRRLGGDGRLDVAAGEIVLPEGAEPQSAWLVRYSIHANAPTETDYVLSRNGLVVSRGRTTLKRGANHFFARDTSLVEGVLEYRLAIRTEGDAVPENNASVGLLRVAGPPRALVVSGEKEPGLLEKSLAAGAIPVTRLTPEAFPRAPAQLAPYKLIALENCRLSDFPGGGVAALAGAVEAGLASLLVTGGPNSFGNGGYHRSALDPLLPVEMELRNEKRRGTLAVAIALDRSGSMAVPAGGGRTKMDLANLGAAESIRLLSPGDEVSVIAVDSSPHLIVPLSRVDDAGALARRVLAIESMGGGIYCHAALKAAEEEVTKSGLQNRHIVLFADAADAEDQEGCFDLAKRLKRDGISISVIAMGERTDSDAQFLMELARLGGGEALFSDRAGGLPALFTQEIVRISRRGFLGEPATPRLLPALASLGLDPGAAPPRLGGFNVSAAREGAAVLMDLDDEFSTPLLALRSTGRAAAGAALFQIDGGFSGTFPVWPEAPELLVALARRLAAGVNRAEVKAYSRLEGGVAETRLEFSPEAARTLRGRGAGVTWLGPGGLALRSELEWEDPTRARAAVALSAPGHYLPLADLPGMGLAPAPAVSLSYSAEFAPGPEADGLAVLKSLADLSGGGEGLDLARVRASARAAGTGRLEARPYLLLALLLLFLLELSGRRLGWFS